MSLQAMFPGTGSENTAASVLRCRLFMDLFRECLHQLQAVAGALPGLSQLDFVGFAIRRSRPDAALTGFRRKRSSQPAFFSFPRIDFTLPPSVSLARFSDSFRISARFSGPLSLRLRRPSSPMVTSSTQ